MLRSTGTVGRARSPARIGKYVLQSLKGLPENQLRQAHARLLTQEQAHICRSC